MSIVVMPRAQVAPMVAASPRNSYEPRGAVKEVFERRDPEILVAGPAGTGKSRGNLEKLHACATKYPNMRGGIFRKTRASITQTAMVTMEERVLPAFSPVKFNTTDQEYRYPNGSRIVVGGFDNSDKIMSLELDMGVIVEAHELLEADLEKLSTRMRNGVMPYQQILMDVNPQGPTHWLKRRAERGDLLMLNSKHEDNPVLWDTARGEWTPFGLEYIAKLDRLTGVRKLRLRHGIWAAAEGMVYEMWDPSVHVIPRFEIPASWPRFETVDFGYNNPFVVQWWARNPDGDLFRYREIYYTGQLVEDLAPRIISLRGEEKIERTIADHDAEDRATLRRHGIPTVAARKALSPGIQAVAKRLTLDPRGRARLYYLENSLVSPSPTQAPRDPVLVEGMKPTCTEEEYESYIWKQLPDGSWSKEEPLDMDNHGMDATRYMVADQDFVPLHAQSAPSLLG